MVGIRVAAQTAAGLPKGTPQEILRTCTRIDLTFSEAQKMQALPTADQRCAQMLLESMRAEF